VGIPEGEQENMRRCARHVAELVQERIALTDEEAALYDLYEGARQSKYCAIGAPESIAQERK
jgi:hypothetical protein